MAGFFGIGRAAAMPAARWGGRIGAGALTGLGIGAATDQDDYTWKDAGIDSGFGAFGAIGGKLAGMGLGALASKSSKIPGVGGFTSSVLQRGADAKFARHGLSGILAGAGIIPAPDQPKGELGNFGGFFDSVGPAFGGLLDKLQGDHKPPTNPLLEGGMFGGMGAPPEFTGSFANYMNDPALQNIANDQIISENQALIRANQVIQRQRNREITATEDAGQNAIDQIGQISRENNAQNSAVAASANQSRDEIQSGADELAANVENQSMADDGTRAELDAERARLAEVRATRQAADSTLLERMASASQNALGEMSAAEAQQIKSNVGSIREGALEKLTQNRVQAKDNWGKKTGMVAGLADTALQRDLQAHQMGLQAWSGRLDALNSWRGTLAETQKMENQAPDPAMLNFMLNSAMKPSGYTQQGSNPETGEKWSYAMPSWANSDPAQVDQMNNYISQYTGGYKPLVAPQLPTGAKGGKWYNPFD